MIYIILPAYNEEARIGSLIDDIFNTFTQENYAFKIVVVDDGSTDQTFNISNEKSRELPVIVLKNPENMGLSETLKKGLNHVVNISDDNDIIVTMDADGTHLPGQALRMIRMIKEGFDVVIASRYTKMSRIKGLKFSRTLLSWVGNIFIKAFFPIRGVRDYTSGFRSYRAEVLKRLVKKYGEDFTKQPGFSVMLDILLRLREFQPIIGDVPMILRYDLKYTSSKMDVRKNIIETLSLIFRRRFFS